MNLVPDHIQPLMQTIIFQLKKKYQEKELDLEDPLLEGFMESYIKKANRDLFKIAFQALYSSYPKNS